MTATGSFEIVSQQSGWDMLSVLWNTSCELQRDYWAQFLICRACYENIVLGLLDRGPSCPIQQALSKMHKSSDGKVLAPFMFYGLLRIQILVYLGFQWRISSFSAFTEGQKLEWKKRPKSFREAFFTRLWNLAQA